MFKLFHGRLNWEERTQDSFLNHVAHIQSCNCFSGSSTVGLCFSRPVQAVAEKNRKLYNHVHPQQLCLFACIRTESSASSLYFGLLSSENGKSVHNKEVRPLGSSFNHSSVGTIPVFMYLECQE